MNHTDIILDEDDDLQFVGGDFAVGASWQQEVDLLLTLNQGVLKRDPLLGPNLIRLVNSNTTQEEVQALVKMHLQRDGKDYDLIKQLIQLKTG